MQLSIGKLAVLLIALLILVTLVTTGMGLVMLHEDYRTFSDQQEAEARDTLRNAAVSIGDRVRFYQGILHLIATKPEVANLLDFGQTDEMRAWSQSLRSLLPGVLGAALASAHGEIYGDAREQRVGPACVSDMKLIRSGASIDFPPLHTDVTGLEHFDLLTRITAPDGEVSGTVFVSFRLDILGDLLQSMVQRDDRFELRDSRGVTKLASGAEQPSPGAWQFNLRIPDTSWDLVLFRPIPDKASVMARLIGIDALILALSGVFVVFVIRSTLSGFKRDMQRVHAALTDVLGGNYHPDPKPTAIKETGILLPDIEQLALRLQDQHNELRHQSLSDPLTGVFNRRYFDMMLAHLHEQSRRQSPAQLLIIDLNDFKQVNDEFGHKVGDRVLLNAAQYLVGRVRATDIVARLGGDEFALILTHMPGDVLEGWIASLVDGFDSQTLEHDDGKAIRCRLSIGATAIDARRHARPSDAFDAADHAMYSVKQRRDLLGSRFAIADETLADDGLKATADPR